MMAKAKLLFICTINRLRSRTAEELYLPDPRFEVKSAGIVDDAAVHITKEMLEWADYIFVMELEHEQYIAKHFPELKVEKKIHCFNIKDEYEYMNPHLIAELKERMSHYFPDEDLPEE